MTLMRTYCRVCVFRDFSDTSFEACCPVCPFSELERLYHLDHSDIQVGHHIQILLDAKNEVSHAQAGEM